MNGTLRYFPVGRSGIRVLSLAFLLVGWITTKAAWCATITIINADEAGEGFNDPTSATPKGGNSGTTRGAQALNAFQYAASLLGSLLYSDVEVLVTARFMPRDALGDPLLDCGSSWAVLGSASPAWVCVTGGINDHPNGDFWYPGALCNRLNGTRLDDELGHPYSSDIEADFNGRVGKPGCLSSSGWYFGLDANALPDEIDLVTVVLHELSHGLGFVTYAAGDGIPLAGTPDVFMAYAYDNAQSRYWFQMTDAQRVVSSENDPMVVFRGPRTASAAQSYLTSGMDGNDRPRLHAPPVYEPGSSISHFTTSANPHLLMEPSISSSVDHVANGIDLTLPFLRDIGWRDPGCNNGILEGAESCDNGAFNSDTAANSCRTTCVFPSCGDGVTDSGEDCDDGAENSNEPGHCRPGCVAFLCGDGVLDTGEECDDAGANANQPDTCRLNCRDPACGDGIRDAGEACDQGASNGNDPNACRDSCELPSCGDGVTDDDEECDTGLQNADDGPCHLDCTSSCGDGVLDPWEECDDAASNADEPDSCRSNCLDPTCGDGILDTGEECDDDNLTANDGCDGSCQLEIFEPADAGSAASAGAGGMAGTTAPDDGGEVGSTGGDATAEPDSGVAGNPGGRHSSVSPDETDESESGSEADEGGKVVRGACGCRSVGTAPPLAPHGLLIALSLLGLRRRRGHQRRVA
jgi:cysteine-rich repeat protein